MQLAVIIIRVRAEVLQLKIIAKKMKLTGVVKISEICP